MQFQDYIRSKRLITEENYKKATEMVMSAQKESFYSIIKKNKLMDEEVLLNVACEFYGCKRLPSIALDIEVNFDLTSKLTRLENCLAIQSFFITTKDGQTMFVIGDPTDDNTKSKAFSIINKQLTYVLISNEEFDMLAMHKITPKINQIRADEFNTNSKEGVENAKSIGGGEIANFITSLFGACIDRRASDLHIISLDESKALISIRVDGAPQKYNIIQGGILENIRNYLCNLCKINSQDVFKADAIDGQFTFAHNDKNIDVRMSIIKTKAGYKMTFRFLERKVKTMQELGMSEDNFEKYTRLINMSRGLVIFCGPTGSGKTTTLYAALNEINNSGKYIITAEDPVEIEVPGISQIEVKGGNYGQVVGPMLRADPDVIVIGEVRKEDAADECVRAANTGHLVFTTVHANDALGVVPRLTKLGIEDYVLGDVLSGIIATRLIRRVCPYCKEEYLLPEDHIWRKEYNLDEDENNPKPIKLTRGRGCTKCANTGYYGRISIMEILIATPELRDAIQEGGRRARMEDVLRKQGQKSMIDDGKEKVLAGITTFDELDKYSHDVS